MIRLHQLLASCLGIGYIKGGGTIAAVVCCTVWYMAHKEGSFNGTAAMVTFAITITGIWSAAKVAPGWGKDSSRVVIDEVAGMCVSLLFIPVQLRYLAAGLLLFRLFDIGKPLWIRRSESLPHGWGVMMDDVLAGLYTNLLLHLLIWFNIF
ncbi:MAG: phosphatidylglycerophosphatase A [Sediminibacterium sp.]